jgi:hypothetical protein
MDGFILKMQKPVKTTKGNKNIILFAERFSRGHSIFLLAVPIIIIEIALRSRHLSPIGQTFFIIYYFLSSVFCYIRTNP